MVTTIQITERTLELLKKLKEELNASSYDETIVRTAMQRKKKSLGGFLGKKPTKELLKDLRDKNDRF